MTSNRSDGTRDAGPRTDAMQLDCQLQVSAVVDRFPSTAPVFDRFGVDQCCTGSLSVEHAAHAHGVEPRTLCDALREATFL